MDRLIFHIDVNSAFLSWEAARRVSEGLPDLRDIPAVIGGDPEKRTGVVLAKSIPAKKFGVKTGEPLAAALRMKSKMAPSCRSGIAISRSMKSKITSLSLKWPS